MVSGKQHIGGLAQLGAAWLGLAPLGAA